MMKNTWKTFVILAFCGAFMMMRPVDAHGAPSDFGGPGLSSGGYVATVQVDGVNINKDHESDQVLMPAPKGSTYHIVEDMGDGWVKVKVKDGYGYLPVTGNATIRAGEDEAEEEASSDNEAPIQADAQAATGVRQQVVNYGLQFVGGRYVYGGNDPRTGVDCSGFTRFVMRNGAGVALPRSSRDQSRQGIQVSAADMRPGDLIFYGKGGRVNHVAMFIGNGQVVHASTYKTGIKISNWNYRAPIRIMNVIGD